MLTTVFAGLFAFVNMAHAVIVADVYPTNPVVIDGDMAVVGRDLILGRWIVVNLEIKNHYDVPIVVDSVAFNVKSREGDVGVRAVPFAAQELAPGATFFIRRTYVDQLPDSKSYDYLVTMTISGWKGTLANKGDSVSLSMQFYTQ